MVAVRINDQRWLRQHDVDCIQPGWVVGAQFSENFHAGAAFNRAERIFEVKASHHMGGMFGQGGSQSRGHGQPIPNCRSQRKISKSDLAFLSNQSIRMGLIPPSKQT